MADFRITENLNSRVTEVNDIRILEENTSASQLSGALTTSFTSFLTLLGVSNLQGESSVNVVGVVEPFASSLSARVNGNWVSVTPYVKINNIWTIPIYIGSKDSLVWKRIY